MFRSALWLCLFLPASAAQAEPLRLEPRETFGQLTIGQPQSGGLELQAEIGDYKNEPLADYGPENPFVQLARAMGYLQVLTNAGDGDCTGFLISFRYLMTNHHCVTGMLGKVNTRGETIDRIEAIQLFMGYVRTGIEEGVSRFVVNPVPVEESAELDFAILEVWGNPSESFGTLPLAVLDPVPNRYGLWIIGHPLGVAQRISSEGCRTDERALGAGKLRHICDTLPGNSGSPVIDPFRGEVLGLHHAGDRLEVVNYAIPMAAIAERSSIVARLVSAAKPALSAAPEPDVTTPVLTVKSDGTGDYRDIAGAIDAAPVGARIEIFAGLYVGGAVVDKPLELVGIGERSSIVWGANDGNVLTWQPASGRIANLSFRLIGGSENKDLPAIDFLGGSAMLEESDISSGSGMGILVSYRARPTIRNNLIHQNSYVGIGVADWGGGAIIDNTILDSGLAGIAIVRRSDPLVEGNEISDSVERGIVVADQGFGKINGNTIRRSGSSGIAIESGGDPAVTGNVIDASGEWGIERLDGGLGQIGENSFKDNAGGPTNF